MDNIGIIIILLVGVVLGLLMKERLWRLWRKIVGSLSLMKGYWIFVALFLPILILVYFVVFQYSSVEDLSNHLNVVGQISTIIFAIFVGYFAFLQIIESRLDKLKESAQNYLLNGDYKRAIEYYEQAHKIAPKDFRVLVNLLEVYLFEENIVKFEDKISFLEKNAIEKQESLNCLYLRALKEILMGHLPETEAEIKKLINFVSANPRILPMRWSFRELRDSEKYRTLKGDSKKIIDNVIAYLMNGLGENRDKFESGNYYF